MAIYNQTLQDAYMLGRLNVKHFKDGSGRRNNSTIAALEQNSIHAYLEYHEWFEILAEMIGVHETRLREFVLSTMRGENQHKAKSYIRRLYRPEKE